MGLILNPIGEEAGGSVPGRDLHRCGKGRGRLHGSACVCVCVCVLYKYVRVRSFASQSQGCVGVALAPLHLSPFLITNLN